MGTHPIFESDFDCLTEMDFVELKCSTSKESGAGDAKDGIKKNDSPISSRSMSPDETRKKDRFDSINYQNEAYDRVEQEDQVDSDNSDDVPLRRKEQAGKDMSDDFKP